MRKMIAAMIMAGSISAGAQMKDGIYSAEKGGSRQWKPYVKLTVKGGRAIGLQLEKRSPEGEDCSLKDENFRREALEARRKFVANPKIETVPAEFRELLNFLMEKAEKGETGNFEI